MHFYVHTSFSFCMPQTPFSALACIQPCLTSNKTAFPFVQEGEEISTDSPPSTDPHFLSSAVLKEVVELRELSWGGGCIMEWGEESRGLQSPWLVI